MSHIEENMSIIQKRIANTAFRCGRNPEEIKLIAVSKNFGIDDIRQAVNAGAVALGENRVQELQEKYEVLGDISEWHLIGHLQTNKVKYAVKMVNWIHSVDKLALAEEISRRAVALDKVINIMIEVNVAEEDSKFGAQSDDVTDLIREIVFLPALRIRGLMTIAPLTDDAETVRPVFIKLREMQEKINASGILDTPMDHLSMGMSGDFEVAIEEGATMIRVGSAIFGTRVY